MPVTVGCFLVLCRFLSILPFTSLSISHTVLTYLIILIFEVFKDLNQCLQVGAIIPSGDVGKGLETFLVVETSVWCVVCGVCVHIRCWRLLERD